MFDRPGHHDPQVSPDGRWVTYNYLDSLSVRELATGAAPMLARRGARAQWSPDDALIAYEARGAIRIMRPDGTEVRGIPRRSPGVFVTDGRIGWSPDGKWLVGLHDNSSDLIEAASGRVLPLAFAAGLVDPIWLHAR